VDEKKLGSLGIREYFGYNKLVQLIPKKLEIKPGCCHCCCSASIL